MTHTCTSSSSALRLSDLLQCTNKSKNATCTQERTAAQARGCRARVATCPEESDLHPGEGGCAIPESTAFLKKFIWPVHKIHTMRLAPRKGQLRKPWEAH